MTDERRELMIPFNGGGIPTLRKSYFLEPILKPRNRPLPTTPSRSLSSNPINIDQLKRKFTFKGRPVPQKNWDTWVQILQQTHHDNWKKVGIFDAIRASTYSIKRHNELIIGLAEKFCPETNTFLFPWGETTISLEDIMILGGFSVLGISVQNPSQIRENEEIENKLVSIYPKIRTNGFVSHYGWMDHFKGIGGELEHIAFLVLWLSRYVFSTNCYAMISPSVFPIAISLARGTQIALAPAVLASIYRDLTLLKEKIVALMSEGGYDCGSRLVLWAPFQLVQCWAWERFPTLGPEPITLRVGEPRLARWQNLKKAKIECSKFEFESLGESFVWRPYTLCVKNWEFPKFYCDEKRLVLVNSEVREEILSFTRCLRACELVGLDCVEQYLPHRVGVQFGMDQDIPGLVLRLNHDLELAWGSFDKPLDGVKFYLPPRLVEGDVTVRYYDWWRSAFRLYDNDGSMIEQPRRSLRKRKNLSMNLDGTAEDTLEVKQAKNSSLDSPAITRDDDYDDDDDKDDDEEEEDEDENGDLDCFSVLGSEVEPEDTLEEKQVKNSSLDSPVITGDDYDDDVDDDDDGGGGGGDDDDENGDLDCFAVLGSELEPMLSEVEPPSEPEREKLCSMTVDNHEEGKSTKDVVKAKQVKNSSVHEENGDLDCFSVLGSEVEPMLCEVEPPSEPEKEKLCSMTVDNHEEGKSTKDIVEAKQVNNSSVHEENGDLNCLGVRDSKLEARPSEVEVELPREPEKEEKLCCMTTNNHEQGKATKAVLKAKLMNNNSLDDPVIIGDDDDDEDNGYLNRFKKLCFKLEARISELEKVVSRIKAAQVG